MPTKDEDIWQENQRINSHLLCEVMEWKATWSSASGKVLLDQHMAIISYEQEDGFPNLYDEHRMPLSWKVVEWATGCPWQVPVKEDADVASLPLATHFGYWWENANLWAFTREEAQAAWLDHVVKLIMATGRVTRKADG